MRKVDGTDRMYHIEARAGNHHDKIELLHTGEKSWDDIATLVHHSVNEMTDYEKLPIRRADCCVDTHVSVDYLAKSVRCQYKRWRSEVGKIELYADYEDSLRRRNEVQFMDIGRRHLETMYLGRKPNPLRCYDKVAEMQYRYHRDEREHYRNAMELNDARELRREFYARHGYTQKLDELDKNLPGNLRREARELVKQLYPYQSFREWDGNKLGVWEFTTLTRIERQMSGDVPLVISTVKGLRDNVLTFNPFERVQFAVPTARVDWSTAKGLTWDQQLAGERIEQMLRDEGLTYDQLFRMANTSRTGKRTGRAAKRLEKYLAFIENAQVVGEDRPIFPDELFEQYRSSIRLQFQIAA